MPLTRTCIYPSLLLCIESAIVVNVAMTQPTSFVVNELEPASPTLCEPSTPLVESLESGALRNSVLPNMHVPESTGPWAACFAAAITGEVTQTSGTPANAMNAKDCR